MIIHVQKSSSGLGLIETVIAIGVLIITSGAALALTNASIRNHVLATERTTANQLAQEAIEIVKNIRDTNLIDECPETGWSEGLTLNGTTDPPVFGDQPLTACGPRYRWQLRGGVEDVEVGGLTYNRAYTITDRYDQASVLIGKEITVTVSWRDNFQSLQQSIVVYNPLL